MRTVTHFFGKVRNSLLRKFSKFEISLLKKLFINLSIFIRNFESLPWVQTDLDRGRGRQRRRETAHMVVPMYGYTTPF